MNLKNKKLIFNWEWCGLYLGITKHQVDLTYGWYIRTRCVNKIGTLPTVYSKDNYKNKKECLLDGLDKMHLIIRNKLQVASDLIGEIDRTWKK